MPSKHSGRVLTAMAAGLCLCCGSSVANASTLYTIAFDDPTNAFTSYYSPLAANLDAAGAEWSNFFVGDATIDVIVRFDPQTIRAGGTSLTSTFVGSNGAFNIFQQGAASEIRTGIDPNGSAADVLLTFDPAYLTQELWFDPDPTTRIAPVPVNKTDAVSVLLHELGHAFGFNGFLDIQTGVPRSALGISSYDALIEDVGGTFYFNGARASAEYGGPVPLSFVAGNTPTQAATQNIYHVGNALGAGTDLIPDLMNGVFFTRGTRYSISPLDVAILADTGIPTVPTSVPEPGTIVLAGFSLGFVLSKRARTSFQQPART